MKILTRKGGWRGPITNKIKNENWEQAINRYKLDPTLNWQATEIILSNSNEIKFKTIDKNKKNIVGTISSKI